MRAIAIIVVILGVAALVFGILFVTQGSSGLQEVTDSIAPLPLDQLDDAYEQAKAGIAQMEAAGMEPDLATKLTKTGLGLAKANKGTAQMVRTSGVVNICVGLGLALAGLGLLRKAQA